MLIASRPQALRFGEGGEESSRRGVRKGIRCSTKTLFSPEKARALKAERKKAETRRETKFIKKAWTEKLGGSANSQKP